MKAEHIIIDVQSYMTAAALVGEGRLKEYYVEYKEADNISGNIYKGRVVNVLKGLQSAFVNFGNVRNGFLAVKETLGHKTLMDGVMPDSITAEEGSYVMVQATKEEIGNKGARLTTNITLPGRYIVFLPNLDFLGVSNKITDEATRDKLLKLLERHKPKGGGFIARTACLEAKRAEILREVKQLFGVWEQIKKNYDEAEGVTQIYSDGDFAFRTVRDMLGESVESVMVNDRAQADKLTKQLKDYKSKYAERVKFYAEPEDICEKYGILGEVDKLLRRKVELRSGISLVFDHTEALTVIDVNTARFAVGDNHEETVFNANLDAAKEAARQIRLRNIGGIIIIDFIDMEEQEHRDAVLEALRAEMLFDRVKTRIVGMTPLGLVEITRKKTGRELSTILLDKCPYCDGDALAPSVFYLARKLKRDIKGQFAIGYTTVFAYLNEQLIDEVFASGCLSADAAGIWRDNRVYLVPDRSLPRGEYRLKASQDAVVTLPPMSRLLY